MKTINTLILTCTCLVVMMMAACSQNDTSQTEAATAATTDMHQNSSVATEPEIEVPKYDADAGVKEHLITADNSKMHLRIDKMQDDSYRMVSWNTNSTELDEPEQEIQNGKIVDEGSWGRAMSFDSDAGTYQITDYSAAGDPSLNLILKKGGNLVESTMLKVKN